MSNFLLLVLSFLMIQSNRVYAHIYTNSDVRSFYWYVKNIQLLFVIREREHDVIVETLFLVLPESPKSVIVQ